MSASSGTHFRIQAKRNQPTEPTIPKMKAHLYMPFAALLRKGSQTRSSTL